MTAIGSLTLTRTSGAATYTATGASALTRPIRRLTQISDGISRGNLAAAITETRRSDEIGSLARAIERLRASVKLAVDRLGAR